MAKYSQTPFQILSLTIGGKTKKSYLKALKPGQFVFNREDSNVFDLYGKNVAVHAIVGRNGSGKSSLLDIIYRLINNFSYYLMKNMRYGSAATPLAFVDGQFATLRYTINDQVCMLEARGRVLALRTPNRNYRVGENKYEEWNEYEDVTGAGKDKIREVMRYFFYTIVTNYAFNAFLSQDYASDATVDLHGESWIDSVFHKNDGYKIPLVLNPYRYEGSVDVQRESEFAATRTIAILTHFKRKRWQFIDGYNLAKVKYNYSPVFLQKFRNYLPPSDQKMVENLYDGVRHYTQEKLIVQELVLRHFEKCFGIKECYASLLMEAYGIRADFRNDVQFATCCYVVYKTFSILEKYDLLEEYHVDNALSQCWKALLKQPNLNIEQEEKKKYQSIVKELEKDDSHVTYKLRLALRFLRNTGAVETSKKWRKEGFDLSEYFALFDTHPESMSVEQIMNCLPMPIFRPKILLNKVDEGGSILSDDPIPFELLSAGEKMYVYTMGTLVYHIMNIKSVNNRKISYRNINIIMDELELSFHPEMQRTFVSKLVSCISRMHLNVHCYFNIILVTHSPFVLSDIANEDILYLDNGVDVSKTIQVNPFGANINDVLSQSFFLHENGFVGEIAQKKISSLVKYLSWDNKQRECKEWDRQMAKIFIEKMVGDPVIQYHLYQMLGEEN